MKLPTKHAICLSLDKRLGENTIVGEVEEYFNIPVDMFVAGRGEEALRKWLKIYDHIDTNELPPHLPGSTDYQTWHRRPNPFNAWKSHQKMLLRAKHENWESVLFLEDDADFAPDWREILWPALKVLEDLEWDLLYLGSYSKYCQKTLVGANLYRVDGCAGWHAIIIKQHMYGYLLQFPPLGPMDWMTAQIHSRCRAYAIIPSVIVQRSGYSFVEGSHLEKKRDE